MRDIIMKSHVHVGNQHKGLLDMQKNELTQIKKCVTDILRNTSEAFLNKGAANYNLIAKENEKLKKTIVDIEGNQVDKDKDVLEVLKETDELLQHLPNEILDKFVKSDKFKMFEKVFAKYDIN